MSLGKTVVKGGKDAVRKRAQEIERQIDRYQVDVLMGMVEKTVMNNKATHARFKQFLGNTEEYNKLVEANRELEDFVKRLKARRRSW